MLKKLCQCIGLASLILAMNYGELLGGGGSVRMHVPYALNGIVYAQLADILLLGLGLFAIIGPLWRTCFYPWVQLVVAMGVPPYLIERIRAVLPFHLVDGLMFLLGVVWAGMVLVLFFRWNDAYRRLMRVGDFAGVFLAVFACCSVVQMLWVTQWRPGPQAHRAAWEGTAQAPRQHPLMVWMVFDELSYEQVFGHRASGLALPNFDALRSESTVYSDAQPIGDQTVKVLPSLLSGRRVEGYRYTFDNRLMVRDAGETGLHQLDGAGTVFADAQREGWRTAAVGWYNPYCTIYSGAIDDCYWMNRDMTDGPMAQDESFWRNMYTPLKQMVDEVVEPAEARREVCGYDVRQRTKTYVDLEQRAEQVLRSDQTDFVLLHLPVPHSPNIWSRARNEYSQECGGSYLDGLALADRELGRVMGILRSSPRWKDTTVMVQGDHSWRTYLWRDEPAWTPEDEAAARGGFDARPAVMVRAAGQTQAAVNGAPWSLLNVHTIVEQVVRGEAVHDESQNLKR